MTLCICDCSSLSKLQVDKNEFKEPRPRIMNDLTSEAALNSQHRMEIDPLCWLSNDGVQEEHVRLKFKFETPLPMSPSYKY